MKTTTKFALALVSIVVLAGIYSAWISNETFLNAFVSPVTLLIIGVDVCLVVGVYVFLMYCIVRAVRENSVRRNQINAGAINKKLAA